MRRYILLAAALAVWAMLFAGLSQLISCIHSPDGNKKDYDYPRDIAGMCDQQKNAARACIEKADGARLPERFGCLVEKHPGEQKFSGGNGWAWKEPRWDNMWVCGLCGRKGGRSWITVGCNPNTGGEVNPNVVKHEFGHHWRAQVKDSSHNPKYQSCFVSWKEPKARVCLRYVDEDNWEMVDYLEDWDEE